MPDFRSLLSLGKNHYLIVGQRHSMRKSSTMLAGLNANSAIVKLNKDTSDLMVVGNNMDYFTSSTIHKTI